MTPLNEQAYNYLQKLIMENHFSYQEVYSETKLSKELGISRTPLRDAVHRLAQEGYIDIIPSKGFMLHQMNRELLAKLQKQMANSSLQADQLKKTIANLQEQIAQKDKAHHAVAHFTNEHAIWR